MGKEGLYRFNVWLQPPQEFMKARPHNRRCILMLCVADFLWLILACIHINVGVSGLSVVVCGEVRSHLLKNKVMAMTCVSYIGGVFFSVVHVLYMLCAKSAGCALSAQAQAQLVLSPYSPNIT